MTRWRQRGVAALAAATLLAACGKPDQKPSLPPPPIAPATNPAPIKPAAVLATSPAPPLLPEMVATIQGSENIPVRPLRSGYVVRQVYKDGTMVAKGDVLFLLDPRTAHDGVPSDASALIQVVSPCAGFPGDSWRGPGDYIDPNMKLVDVALIDKVDAEVSLPNALAEQFSTYIDQSVTASAPAQGDFELTLPDGRAYREKGTFGIIASGGGVNTMSITFPNPGHIMLPGEFVKVRSAVP
jgi:multidrug efflux pump subunit AcrA (membrane-fusion protein)